jgi:hypothetical protein
LEYWIRSKITDTIHDKKSYDDWLALNKSIVGRVSSKRKNGLSKILPKISARYRQLIINWASDPKIWIEVAGFLKASLGFG